MGITSFRIPGDVANIIQGYEGVATLYFSYDNIIDKISLSTKTPLKDGEKVIIDPTMFSSMSGSGPNVYFFKITGNFPRNGPTIDTAILLVFISNITSSILKTNIENNQEIKTRLLNAFKNENNRAEMYGQSIILTATLMKSYGHPYEIEDPHYIKTIFDKYIRYSTTI